MKKILMMALAALLALTALASASPVYTIEKIAINGLFIDTEKVMLELGTNAQIDVWVKGTSGSRDIKVKAWIAGYEYEDVQAVSETFTVTEGVMHREELYLEIPRDLRLGSNDYQLHIEVYDKNDYIERVYPIFIQERMHDIAVQDVIVRPGTMVDAGRTLAIQVRLENYGSRKEQNIKVEARLPQLGAVSSTWVDLLDAYGSDDNSESTGFIPLTIPSDAVSGDYQLQVKVLYSNLHEETTSARLIYVIGKEESEKLKDAEESIVIISAPKKYGLGEEVSFKIAIANLGDKSKAYTFETDSVNWANVGVQDKIDIAPGSSGQAIITLTPMQTGSNELHVAVRADGNIIKESVFNVNVLTPEEEKGQWLNSFNGIMGSRQNTILFVMVAILLLALLVTLSHGMRRNREHPY